MIELGFEANENPPEIVRYDRSGRRVDEIAFHPAWHELMELAVDERRRGRAVGGHARRARTSPARRSFLMLAQVEAGITCPLAMTYSCVPALRLGAESARLGAARHERRATTRAPLPAAEKRGALIGMALTERSRRLRRADERDRRRRPDGDGACAVTGTKWFVSAAQSDAFFVLAHSAGGLSLLLVPRLRRGRRAQRPALRPPEAEARQPLQPDRRGRARRRARRRSSARRAAACARSWR